MEMKSLNIFRLQASQRLCVVNTSN